MGRKPKESALDQPVEIGSDDKIKTELDKEVEATREQLKKAGRVIVTHPFRDKNDFTKAYHIGDDISHFDQKRVKTLIENGYAETK